MKNHFIFLGILILSALYPSGLSGQSIVDEPEARRLVKSLEESVLIVRLPVNGPKIRFLTNALARATNDKVKKNLASELAETKALNDRKHTAIRNALQEFYHISPYLIMPDSSYLAFTLGEKHVFLGENGEIDTGVYNRFDNYFLLIAGENDDQWVLVDKNLRKQDKPFPHRSTIFLSGLRRVFARDNYYERQVKWFNAKLKSLL